MKVSEFMTKEVFSISSDRTVEEAARVLIEKNISALPIVDSSSSLVGIITESDFTGKNADVPHALVSLKKVFGKIFYSEDIEAIYDDVKHRPLREVMTERPKTIGPDESLSDAVIMMNRLNLKRIPVVQGTKLVGIITRHDVVKAFMMLEGSKGNEPGI